MNPVLPAPHCRFSSSKNAGKVRTFILPPKGQTQVESCLSLNQRNDMGLVISRKVKQSIYIKQGDRVVAEIEVTKIKGKHVWININADQDLRINKDKDLGEERSNQEI